MKRFKKIVGGIILTLVLSVLFSQGLVRASGNTNDNTSGGPSLDDPKIFRRGWHESHK